MWNIILWVGLTILSALLAPKPKPPKPAALDEFDVPTAEEGRPVPVALGTVWVKSGNVVWYGDLRVDPIYYEGGKK